MQCRHLYIAYDATKVVNATIAYQVKHAIINNDMI
jgi:hypothetical protein